MKKILSEIVGIVLIGVGLIGLVVVGTGLTTLTPMGNPGGLGADIVEIVICAIFLIVSLVLFKRGISLIRGKS
jgi:hypothetical protein